MSFYGSVYYQLIDAFHKVIVNNKGKSENNKFADAANYKNGSYVQAEGRKGVITLDSGNAWIGLTKENDSDNSIKIWHRKPQPLSSSSVAHPFKKLTQLPSGATATTLKEADIIESCTIQYDEAGHATFTPIYYKLPKTDTTTEITNIKNTIGMDNVPAASKLPAVTEESSKNLYGYIAKNKADIDTASTRIDAVEKNTGTDWPYSNFRERSITNIIGDYRKVFNSSSKLPTDNGGFKSLSDIIGNFYSISTGTSFDTDPVNKPANLTAAILALKTLLETAQAESEETDKNIMSLMGAAYIPAGRNLYTEITNLDSKIDTTKVDLETRIESAEDAIDLLTNGVGTKEIDSVNELIEYVKAHGPEVTGINKNINDLKSKVGDQTVSDQIDAKLAPIKALVGTDSVSDQIDAKLAPVKQLIGTETVSTQIDDKLEALVGTETVSKQIDDKLASYSTTADINSKFALQSDLNALSALVGTESVSNQIDAKLTSYSTTTDIDSKISTALSDYALQSDLNTLSGLVGVESVPTQIENAFTEANLSQYATNATLENYYDKTGVETKLSTYASKGDLDQYITEDDLNNTEGNIMAILGDRKDDDTETVFQKFDNYILKSEIDYYIANSIGTWQSSVNSQIEALDKKLKELTGQTDDGSEGGSEGTESGGNTGTEPGTNPEGTEPGGDTEGTDPEGDIE